MDTTNQEKANIDLEIQRKELELKIIETKIEQARLSSEKPRPKDFKLIVALVGLLGTIFGAILQGYNAQFAERQKFEAQLILSAVNSNNIDQNKRNLEFLIGTGLIKGKNSNKRIKNILKYDTALQVVFSGSSEYWNGISNSQSIPYSDISIPPTKDTNLKSTGKQPVDSSTDSSLSYNSLFVAQLPVVAEKALILQTLSKALNEQDSLSKEDALRVLKKEYDNLSNGSLMNGQVTAEDWYNRCDRWLDFWLKDPQRMARERANISFYTISGTKFIRLINRQ